MNSSKSTASEVEVVTDLQVKTAELSGLAESIEQSINLIVGHEQAFAESTLEHCLEIGLHIAKAQEIFTLSTQDRASLGGDAKAALSTVDKAPSPAAMAGFSGWLLKTIPRLKRGRAIHYAQAFRSLELTTEARPSDIRAKLKTLRHQAGRDSLPMPTLKSLAKLAPKIEKPTEAVILIPKTSKQLKLEDAREIFHLWMESWDKAVKQGHLDHLDKPGLLQLQDFTATVRDRIKARLK